jgi:hypothetical protein
MIKNLKRSVAEGGKIKIGGKGELLTGQGGATYARPRKDDHFTITTNMRENGDPNANLITNEKIMAALHAWADADGKVRRLPIMLLSDDVDEVFPTAYVAYSGKHMACRGDGETATRFISPRGEVLAEPETVECPCERLEKDSKGGRRCKFTGILHCSLRLPGHAVIGSVYRWRTTSEISVTQIVTHLQDIILPAAGTLRGLPLMLVLRPQQVSPGGRLSTVYVCHIDLCEDLVIAQRAALEAATMRRELAAGLRTEPDYRATLQLPGSESPEEQAEIAPEYYPDEIVGTAPLDAEVQPGVPAEVLDAPLTGLVPAAAQSADSSTVANQPPAPARTRKTKCKACGEMFGAGVVKGGKCTECRKQAPAPEADAAPEIGGGPPVPPAQPASATTAAPALSPYKRIQQAFRAAVGRGVSQEAVLSAMREKYPDVDRRHPDSWTEQEADMSATIISGLEP